MVEVMKKIRYAKLYNSAKDHGNGSGALWILKRAH